MEIAGGGGEIWTLWSEMNQKRTFHIPKKTCKHNLTLADGLVLNFLSTRDVGRFQAILWALLSGL
jgi:hypothetical protein